MKRVFKHVDVDLVTPPQNGGGSGGGSSKKMQQLSNMVKPGEVEEKAEKGMVIAVKSGQADENKQGHSKLSYEKTKEKIQKQIIREMLEKLVIEQVKEHKIGRDFLHKRHISRDVCIEAEFRIPNETYSIRKKPMHFYFDFSGSCSRYSSMFAQITAGLIEKGAVTYIGENGDVSFRIDKAPRKINARDIGSLFDRSSDHERKGFDITYYDDVAIQEVIKSEQVERLICYTDYDSCREMVRSSTLSDIIWFSAQSDYRDFNVGGKTLKDFKGRFYQARSLDEIKNNLANIDNIAFEKRCRMIQTGEIIK